MTAPNERLPYCAALSEYQRQADELLARWNAGDAAATRFFW